MNKLKMSIFIRNVLTAPVSKNFHGVEIKLKMMHMRKNWMHPMKIKGFTVVKLFGAQVTLWLLMMMKRGKVKSRIIV